MTTFARMQLFKGNSTTSLQRQANEFFKNEDREVWDAKLHNCCDGSLVLVLLYNETKGEGK